MQDKVIVFQQRTLALSVLQSPEMGALDVLVTAFFCKSYGADFLKYRA
jgi:hypothetical protein